MTRWQWQSTPVLQSTRWPDKDLSHWGVTYSTSPQESIRPPIIFPYSSEPANKSRQQDRFIRLTVTTSSCHSLNPLDQSGLIRSGLKGWKKSSHWCNSDASEQYTMQFSSCCCKTEFVPLLENSLETFSIRKGTIDKLKKLCCLLLQRKP